VRIALAAVLALASLPSPAGAESLAAAAQRTRERREARAAANAGSTYTEADLASRHVDPLADASLSSDTSPAPAGETSRPLEGSRARPIETWVPTPRGLVSSSLDPSAARQGSWRLRAQVQLSRIEAKEQLVRELEAGRAPEMETVTLSCGRKVPAARSKRVTTLAARLDEARAGLAQARQAYAELEDEARVNRIPPGWLR